MSGPVPKRSEERRRRNKEGGEIVKVDVAALAAEDVTIPAANEDWHPTAYAMYESLMRSGQAIFYEPSDWALAYTLCETLSRALDPVPMVVGAGEDSKVEFHEVPLPGAALNAFLKGMASLMVTEGDRRRLRIELERAKAREAAAGGGGSVIPISQKRQDRFRREA